VKHEKKREKGTEYPTFSSGQYDLLDSLSRSSRLYSNFRTDSRHYLISYCDVQIQKKIKGRGFPLPSTLF